MKSITIHNLDEKTTQLIQRRSKESGLSLNKTIKKLLQKALGISEPGKEREDFSEFSGVWNLSDYDEFMEHTIDFRGVDKEDWA